MKNTDYYLGLNYRINIIQDEAEGGFVLSCPELKGCITCSDTVENGIKMICDAKKAWIKSALEDGIIIPMPCYNSSN